MRSTTRLRQLLDTPGLIVAPGAYDGFSARLIEAAGFSVIYMTGAGTAASHLGQPDLGLATLTEMANHASHLASAVSLPVIADADTGYGNALNAVRTVREYEKAGVAGLHMEDQVAPKKCGHISGKQVVSTREFAEKIRAASEHRGRARGAAACRLGGGAADRRGHALHLLTTQVRSGGGKSI